MFERMVPLKSTGSCGTCVRASSQTDDADDAADEVAVEVVDVDAVEQHLAARRLVQSAQQRGDGALSRSGAAHDADVLSGTCDDV